MDLSKVSKLFEDYGISRAEIAKKMGMNEKTFRFKLDSNYPQYRFLIKGDDDEILKLSLILKELGEAALEASKRGFEALSVSVVEEDTGQNEAVI